MTANTIHLQYKLNPSAYPKEKKAYAIYQEMLAKGHSGRYIHTMALLKLKGVDLTPEENLSGVMEKLRRVEKKLDDQAETNALIVDALQRLDLSQYVSSSGRSIQEELGGLLPETVHKTIASGIQGKKFNVD